ncbi:hypothetical protein SAMN05421503_3426 [Terribacillus aidingensis]|uniref:Uncharacterized protein n=1 Tax=Terribacillus aidingensis TaxID=586416 RepID=A0A285P8D9_9BACI|nr:hypothetical protein [Terribacillus aidingensis]SNZ17984.1 hypothetical protein SAMN05421503_3426 [Terribacillus aidingensis]
MNNNAIIIEEERYEFIATVISYIGLILTMIGATIALYVSYASYKRSLENAVLGNGAIPITTSVIA